MIDIHIRMNERIKCFWEKQNPSAKIQKIRVLKEFWFVYSEIGSGAHTDLIEALGKSLSRVFL
jgi:hypothetical protein